MFFSKMGAEAGGNKDMFALAAEEEVVGVSDIEQESIYLRSILLGIHSKG